MAVKSGFIYVLTHPSDPYLIKVGMTTRSPNVRLREHNTQFDKVAGKVVEATGQAWILKDFYAVEDTYNAESAFFHRSPLTELPYHLSNELVILDDEGMNWDWVNEGLEIAKAVGIRKDTSQPPIPKPIPKRGAKWIEAELRDSDLMPLKGYGNGMTKVSFKCSQNHIFRISGCNIVRFPFCPVCEPESFDEYTLRSVEVCE